jgi:hypothetical protein
MTEIDGKAHAARYRGELPLILVGMCAGVWRDGERRRAIATTSEAVASLSFGLARVWWE